MKKFKLVFLTIIMLLCIVSVQSQSQEYMYISNVQPLSSIKIEGSDLNKYVDTSDFFYKGSILPNDYIRQNLKNGTYYQYFLQDTTKIATKLIYRNKTLIEFKSYWFNDTLKHTVQFIAGYKDGKEIVYYQNGKINAIYIYMTGRGFYHEYFFYYSDGNLHRQGKELELGNGKYRLWETKDYYTNGQLKLKGQTKNGYKIGTWTYYNQDGTIKEVKEHNGTEWGIIDSSN